MRTLLLCYGALSFAQIGNPLGAQSPSNGVQGTLNVSAQVRSLRQFYWVRELPRRDEVPGQGRIGYFGGEANITLLWGAKSDSKTKALSLRPNCWHNILEFPSMDSLIRNPVNVTIQMEME